MSKFKVGDVVIGNEKANQYSVTTEGYIGLVTGLGEHDSNNILVKPLDRDDHEGFEVRSDCFDLKAPKLTKQATLDLLSTQRDCYYSLEQVVEMINKIEDPKPEPVTSGKITILEEDYNAFIDEVVEHFDEKVKLGQELVDLDSAYFRLNGNEIELDSVELYKDDLTDMVQDSVDKILSKYVVLQKSTSL